MTKLLPQDTALASFPAICPVLHLPIIQKKRWDNVPLSDDFRMSCSVIGSSILQIRVFGYATRRAMQEGIALRNEVLSGISPDNGCCSVVLDCTGFVGMSPAARHYLMKLFAKEGKQSAPILFESGSECVPRSLQQGKRVNPAKTSFSRIGDSQELAPVSLQYIVFGGVSRVRKILRSKQNDVPFTVHFARTYSDALMRAHQPGSLQNEKGMMQGVESEGTSRDSVADLYAEELLAVQQMISFFRDFSKRLDSKDVATAGSFQRSAFNNLVPAITELQGELNQLPGHRFHADEPMESCDKAIRSLVASMPDVLFAIDREAVFTYVNPCWERILGHTKTEVIGRLLADFTNEEGRPKALFLAENARGYAVIKNEPIMLVHKNGSRRLFTVSTAPHLDSTGRQIGHVGILKDVTDQRHMGERYSQAQKMAAIATLAGGVAHDINNILMIIQGYVSLMLLHHCNEDSDRDRLKGIERQVKNGADLTQQLLGFAQTGNYQLEKTNLNLLVSQSAKVFGRTKKGIRIHEKMQKDLWPVEVDRPQIEQVLMGLYLNAYQAMPAGGDLWLETDNIFLDGSETHSIELACGRYVRIIVRDNGLGMDKEIKNRIFEPFFTTREMGRGTGLGLAAAYGILKGHGGLIEVQSRKGRGTAFYLYIPAKS